MLTLTGSGGSGRSAANLAIDLGLGLFDWVVVGPLVSALRVPAVSDVRAGEEPRLRSIARRGLAALPVPCAATTMSWLGIYGGLLLLVVPGIVLWTRWLVVAQAAALEREGWIAALRRSRALTEGSSVHALAFLVCTSLILPATRTRSGRAAGTSTPRRRSGWAAGAGPSGRAGTVRRERRGSCGAGATRRASLAEGLGPGPR